MEADIKKQAKIEALKKLIESLNNARTHSTMLFGGLSKRVDSSDSEVIADIQLELLALGCLPEDIPQRWDPH